MLTAELPRTCQETNAMAYTVPPLPYPFDALEPHIDAKTMEIHHDKHHVAYVTNLNNAITNTDLGNQSIESLCAGIEKVPENIRTAVRNNGGGHANHSLFWTVMGPGGGGALGRNHLCAPLDEGLRFLQARGHRQGAGGGRAAHQVDEGSPTVNLAVCPT